MDTAISRQGVAIVATAAHDQLMATIQQAAAAEIGKHRRLLHTGGAGRILSALRLPHIAVTQPAAAAARVHNILPYNYGECVLHLRGRPNRTKVQELQRYWFDTGTPIAIDLKETQP